MKKKYLNLIVLFIFSLSLQGKSDMFEKLYARIQAEPSKTISNIEERYLNETDDEQKAEYAFLLGLNHYYLNNCHISVRRYKEALESKHLSKELQSQAYNNMGVCYDIIDKKDLSLESYLNALSISEELKDKKQLARNHINIGLLYCKTKNHVEARNFLFKGLGISKQLKDSILIGLSYQNLSVLYYGLEIMDSCNYYNYKSLNLYEEIGYERGIIQMLYNIALAYYEKGDYQKAITRFESLLFRFEGSQYAYQKALSMITLARCYFLIDMNEIAYALTDSAIAMMNTLNENVIEEQILINKALFAKDSSKVQILHRIADILYFKNKEIGISMQNTLAELQSVHGYEIKNKELSIAKEKYKIIKTKNILLIVLVFIFLLLSIYSYSLYSKTLSLYRVIKNIEIQNLNKKSQALKAAVNDTEKRDTEVFQQILELMAKGLHLKNPNFSIEEMATELGINRTYVSTAINNISGKNFNQFVNGYRIGKAQKMLSDPTLDKQTLADIAIKCGFSSPTTFFRHFKENTGLTPNVFKKAQK